MARAAKCDPTALEFELRHDDASGTCVLEFVASSLVTARAALLVDLGAQTIELRVRDRCASVGAEGRLLHSYDPMSRFAREGEHTRTTGPLVLGGGVPQLDSERYLQEAAGGELVREEGGRSLLRFKHQQLEMNGWLTPGPMWLQLAVLVRPPIARALGARPAASGGDFDSPIRPRSAAPAAGAENQGGGNAPMPGGASPKGSPSGARLCTSWAAVLPQEPF